MDTGLNKKIKSIKEIIDKYSTYFFDLTGVVVCKQFLIFFSKLFIVL